MSFNDGFYDNEGNWVSYKYGYCKPLPPTPQSVESEYKDNIGIFSPMVLPQFSVKPDEVVRVPSGYNIIRPNPKEVSASKLKWTLLNPMWKEIKDIVEILNFGISKGYTEDSWMNETIEHHVNAAFRHLMEWLSGNKTDESGKSHMAHVVCRLMFVMHLEKKIPQPDKDSFK